MAGVPLVSVDLLTAAGVSADGRRRYLVAVDGAGPGLTPGGTSGEPGT